MDSSHPRRPSPQDAEVEDADMYFDTRDSEIESRNVVLPEQDRLSLTSMPTFQATFSHRTALTTTTPGEPKPEDHAYESDFLCLMTAAADLYKQDGVLEMQHNQNWQEAAVYHDSGATSVISKISASFTHPSASEAYHVQQGVRLVVMKKYPSHLFSSNGRPLNSVNARSLVTEFKILSHPGIRASDNVVTLLGLHWDLRIPSSPEPIILLEYAEFNLDSFIKKFRNLPFSTKLSLATDIAHGLSVLHKYGVVHGDIKLDNILIFGDPYRAKLADFGHSLLDAGVSSNLPGGTEAYTAPEWRETASVGQLQLTDVFSYGIVFTSIMCGSDIASEAVSKFGLDHLQALKKDEKDIFLERLLDFTNRHSDLTLEDPTLVRAVMRATLRKDPSKRDLFRVVSLLTSATKLIPTTPPSADGVSVHTRFEAMVLCIPYQALEPIDNAVKDLIVRSLDQVAKLHLDYRYAAACWELCVCYSSDFGVRHYDTNNNQSRQEQALEVLIRSAIAGDHWARLAVQPIFASVGRTFPPDLPLISWLQDLVAQGSSAAFSQLERLDPAAALVSLELYRKTFCGNSTQRFASLVVDINAVPSPDEPLNVHGDTVLHYAASTGNLIILKRSLDQAEQTFNINNRNLFGETPLLQAARAGQTKSVQFLVNHGADAALLNGFNEGALHFITEFGDSDVGEVANALTRAGGLVHLQQVSLDSTCNKFLRLYPTGPGTPIQRVVLAGKAKALEVLFHLEENSDCKDLRTTRVLLCRLLAYAVKLRYIDVMYTLIVRLSQFKLPKKIRICDNGQLRSLGEVWVFGNVAVNPSSGFDWPERFSRLMNFGPRFREVLIVSFHLLSVNRLLAKDCRFLLKIAVENSRRDAVTTCLVPHLMDEKIRQPGFLHTLAITPSSHNISGIKGDIYQCSKEVKKLKAWPALESSDHARGLSLDPPNLDPPLKNHRRAWLLAEWVDYAILHDERAIFYDLIQYDGGLALTPGTRSDLVVSARTSADSYESHDYTILFPPPSYAFVIRPSQVVANAQYADKVYDGTINYALLYMNSISRAIQQDESLPIILLNAMSQLCPSIQLTWTTAHWFEEMCLGSSTYHSADFVSPLYHAAINQWENMIIFLLQHGASPQDTLPATKSTVVNALLESMVDPEPSLLKLIEIATRLKIPHILAAQDLYTLLLHPHNAKRNLRGYDTDKLYYTSSIHWLEDTSGYKLTWRRPEVTRSLGADLWAAIKKANDIQTSQIDFANYRSHLMTMAVLQQNPAAVTCLLQLGMLPTSRRRYQRFFTPGPMDAIRSVTAVPDSCCHTEGLELKRNLREISDLLEPLQNHKVRTAGKLFLYDSIPPLLHGFLLALLCLLFIGGCLMTFLIPLRAISASKSIIVMIFVLFFWLALLMGAVYICFLFWFIFVAAFWMLKALYWIIWNMLLGVRLDSSLDDFFEHNLGGLQLFRRGSDLAYLVCGGSLASVYASSTGPLKQTLLRFVLWHEGGWYRPAQGYEIQLRFATLYVDYLIGQMHEAKELRTPVFHNEDPFGGTERRKQQPQNTIPSSRKFDLWRRKAPTPTNMEFTMSGALQTGSHTDLQDTPTDMEFAMSGALQPGSHTDLRESRAEEILSLSSPPPPARRYWSLFTSRLFRPVRRILSPRRGDRLESLADVTPYTDSIPLEHQLNAV